MGITPQQHADMERRLERNRNVKKGLVQPAAVSEPVNNTPFAPGKRLRQDRRPNKFELEIQRHLEAFYPQAKFSAQAMTLRLASGARYKPDVVGWIDGRMHAYEAKGGRKMKGSAKGALTIKLAAEQWPEIVFHFIWKQDGSLLEQTVQPWTLGISEANPG